MGGRLDANTAPGIDGVPKEILKEMIGAYPEISLEAFNSFPRERRLFVVWKKQRLFLLRKGKKTLGDASSYRSICLLDTVEKLLEEMFLQRLQGHIFGENGLSENQFSFRRNRSTVDAIQTVVDIATKERRGICIEAMVRKKVPDYLLRMIDDYLSDRWVIYEGDKWSLKEEMTCGASQGSRVGPLVWNVM